MSTLLREIAVAAGSQKLIAGQVADLEAEGKNVNRRELALHSRKQDRCDFDNLSASGRDERQRGCRKSSPRSHDFGRALGLAFQVIDDILDVTQTSESLAKAPAKMWRQRKRLILP